MSFLLIPSCKTRYIIYKKVLLVSLQIHIKFSHKLLKFLTTRDRFSFSIKHFSSKVLLSLMTPGYGCFNCLNSTGIDPWWKQTYKMQKKRILLKILSILYVNHKRTGCKFYLGIDLMVSRLRFSRNYFSLMNKMLNYLVEKDHLFEIITIW